MGCANQKINKAIKAVKKALPGFCGISAATIKATTAILHQGKYKQAAKLNKAVSSIDVKNFIVVLIYLFLKFIVAITFLSVASALFIIHNGKYFPSAQLFT